MGVRGAFIATRLSLCILTVVASALILFEARDAMASPSAKLVYVRGAGAESCPGEGELRKAVAQRLGYDPFFPVAQKTVVAQVQRVSKGYRGRVQIVGDDGNVRGERELSTKGDDCTELVGALALAVSIALDDLDEAVNKPPPTKEEPPPPPPPSTKPTPPVVLPPPPEKPTPPPVAPAVEPSSTKLTLSLGPLIALGTAPDAAAGASLAIAVRFRTVALRIDARGELPSSKTLPQGGRIATNVLVATASFCLHARIPFACLGMGSGALFSSTEGITRPRTDRASLLVGLARGGADILLNRAGTLYLEPFAEIGANLLARSVEVDGQAVYETSPVWGALGLHFGGYLF